MNITIKNELNPVFETVGLLYFSNLSDWKEELMKEFPAYGFDGEAFYNKHLKIVEKYLKVFQKHKVSFPEEQVLFCEDCSYLFILLASMASWYREYLESEELPDSMELRSFIAYSLMDIEAESLSLAPSEWPRLADEREILTFMDQHVTMPDKERWKILQMLRSPGEWFAALRQGIHVNLPAYEKAREAVEKPLEKLIRKNPCEADTEFLKIVEMFAGDMTIYLSLILPVAQVVLDREGYYGVLSLYISANAPGEDASRELFQRQLKALSDKSKMEILCELKKSRMYNLEMSEKLKLSPSTMSHHMSALLTCGFVSVEKEDGKVYYCMNKETIESFVRQLEILLLK